MSQVLLHPSPGSPLPNGMLVQVPHPCPFTHPLPCDPHPLPNPDLHARPGLSIPCASGTVLSENASHPLQNSSLPSASATPFQAPAVPNMTNPKEKTPMCLVNELARFNKIQPEYQLLSEEGPAHSKVFTVRLLLGEQCWEGEGTSIKKAQHAVATSALAQSNLPRPSLRSLQNTGRNPDSITPTVQLNARCMKLGKKPIYKTLDAYPNARPNYGTRPPGPYPRYYYPFPPSGPVLCHIELSIGGQQFQGKGRTHQAAKHDAAAKALEALQNEPLLDPQPEVCKEQTERNLNKSEISQVFEIALKRNMPVSFEVQREAGPPHMKSFAVRVSVGEFSGEGEGKSKKAAKRNAAAAVLEELRRLPPAEKPQMHVKKQSKSIVKLQTSAEYGQGTNPICRLAQIQQAEKEKEPEYVLLSERGLPRRREFSMQVKVRDRCAEGMGPSKKVAKRNAADKMLELLGFKTQPQPPKPALKTEDKVQMKKPGEGRKVTFFEPSSEEESVSGPKEDEYRPHFQCRQQLPAGILPMVPELAQAVGASQSRPAKACRRASPDPRETTLSAMIANELLYAGTSCTAETIAKGSSVVPTPALSRPSRPSEQLDYLASVQGLQVEYKDFPKNNKNEFVSLVNCSSQPPLISHGIGKDVESCHDMAALNILKLLSELEQLPNDRPGNHPSSAGGKREMAGKSLHKQAIHKVPEKNGHCV